MSSYSAENLYQLLPALYRQRDYLAAVAELTRALELDPEDPETYRRRGRARFKQRDFAGAIADFGEVIRRAPEDADAHVKRGVARLRAGDAQGAAEDQARTAELGGQALADE